MAVFPRHGDDMDMSGMDMNMTSSGSMSSMGSMGMSNGSTPMMTMMVAFQNDMATPLYSMTFMPTNMGQYAGACIFLIVLAFVFRGLFALKAIQEARWLDQEMNRRFVVVKGQLPMHETLSRESLKQNMVLSANGVEEQVMVVKKHTSVSRPWRASVDPVRAIIDTVIAGVGYLL